MGEERTVRPRYSSAWYADAVSYLYLHGFGSSPLAKKAVAFAERFPELAFARPDLRVPSFEHMTLSAMIAATRAAIGDDRAVIVGSSLGGLTAARTAERDPRVRALVLLAPAFQLAARWRAMLGDAFAAWEATGWRDVTMTTGEPARLHFDFIRDLERVDVGVPAIAVPTLIFHGTRDDVVPIAHSRAFVAANPHARLVELDDGHELMAALPAILDGSAAFFASLT